MDNIRKKVKARFFSFLLLSMMLFTLISLNVEAAEQPIKLTGNIEVSIKLGTLEADLQLQHIPKLNDYLIHINSGLNIEFIKDTSTDEFLNYKKSYEPALSEESFGYQLIHSSKQKRFMPESFRVKLTGKFPVIADLEQAKNYGDWKGNIAFNGKTLRTDGFQTAWYPIIYDVDQDKRYDEVQYDLNVTCLDCSSIYVNGSKPVKASKAQVSTTKPTSINLFIGDYEIAEHSNSFYLNSKLSTQQIEKLATLTQSFKRFFEQKLSIPYGDDIVYIHATPVSKQDSWLFVVYPSIVVMNHNETGLSNLVTTDDYQSFIGHELGHYYFGTYKVFNSELGDMLTESFAEFLALKLTKALISEEQYYEMIDNKFSYLNDTELPAINQVTASDKYGDRELYVYVYGPLIWLAVEQEIGEPAMWQWLNKLLTTPSQLTNAEFMTQTLSEVLQDEVKLKQLTKRYFDNTDAIKNAKARLKR